MRRRRSDAIFVRRRGLTLVIPDEGPRYYVRAVDGAIGRRDGEIMLWVVRIDGVEVIATEDVGDDVRAVERAAEDLMATVGRLPRGTVGRRGRPRAPSTR